jgi:hypothetical protein
VITTQTLSLDEDEEEVATSSKPATP